jgi:adhesin/invasin
VADPVSGVVADGTATSTLTVTVRDASSNLVADQPVFFEITGGTGGTLSAGPWTTDVNGVATATLSSTTPGTLTVTGRSGHG